MLALATIALGVIAFAFYFTILWISIDATADIEAFIRAHKIEFLGFDPLKSPHRVPTTWKRFHQLYSRDKEASRLLCLQLFPASHSLLARKRDDGKAEAILIAIALRVFQLGINPSSFPPQTRK